MATSRPPNLITASNPPFRPNTRPSLITFETHNVQGPSDVYVTTQDQIQVIIWNSAAGVKLAVNWRILRADGQIVPESELVTPTSDRARNTFNFTMPEGFILSFTVQLFQGVAIRGQCFVTADIIRRSGPNFSDYQSLCSDYVTFDNGPQWPGGRSISSLEGPGWIHTVTVPQPAAAAPILITGPANARWRVITIATSLVTSAVAGNRRVVIEDSPSPATFGTALAATTQPAITTLAYYIADYGTQPVDQITFGYFINIPPNRVISAFQTVAIAILFGDVADQLSSAAVGVEEWIEPQS